MGTNGFPHPPMTMGAPPVSAGSKEAPNSTMTMGGQVMFNGSGAGVVVPDVVVPEVLVLVLVVVVAVVVDVKTVVVDKVVGGGGSGV